MTEYLNSEQILEKCPICRAKLKASPQCRRCGADLSKPLASLADAQLHFTRSVHYYRHNNFEKAIREVECAISFKRAPLYLAWLHFLG